jgi:pimeloyl-ACP methyl ester carboxylesterase
VGHSWGSLIALEAAARLGERISHLVLVGTAFPMKVSPALLDAALNNPMKALQMINVFSRSTLAAAALHAGPRHLGLWRGPGAGPARAAQQPEGERVSPRLQGLRQLRQRRAAIAQVTAPGAVPAGRAGPDDASPRPPNR